MARRTLTMCVPKRSALASPFYHRAKYLAAGLTPCLTGRRFSGNRFTLCYNLHYMAPIIHWIDNKSLAVVGTAGGAPLGRPAFDGQPCKALRSW